MVPFLSFMIFVTICCCTQTSNARAVCEARSKVTINKHLGSTFNFQCKPSPCGGIKFNYTHHNQMTGMPDLAVEASKYSRKLLSFDHGGDYCCSDQCSDSKSTDTECCITVAVLPVIQWDLPKAVALNGDPVTASCTASGYPRPSVRVIIPGCDYQQNNVYIGSYTNKAVFTMNVTKRCEQIYCLVASKTYSLLKTNNLLIVDNVLIENLPECIRRIRSIPKTISTSIAKEESRLIAIRNTDNDGNEITYARGDGIATTTCNMMMTTLMTSLLLSILVY